MKFSILLKASVLGAFFVLNACNDDERTQSAKAITEMEKRVYADTASRINMEVAQNLVLEYGKFTQLFPSDTLAPQFLFKAGELSLGLNNPKAALGYFGQVVSHYPSSPKASYSLFMQGFINDGPIKDSAQARKYFSEFLIKYPKHPLAKDAEFSLVNLGRTDDELVREFEKRMAESGQKTK
jgi:outer membrane protein assembly factor BamD (BamD/ComL family)